jgi:hypothetical protein
MAYQFHRYHEAKPESVIHRITLSAYPARVFSAYLGASGELVDAESRPAHYQTWHLNRTGFRNVRRGSPQWRALAIAARAIYATETRNTESV